MALSRERLVVRGAELDHDRLGALGTARRRHVVGVKGQLDPELRPLSLLALAPTALDVLDQPARDQGPDDSSSGAQRPLAASSQQAVVAGWE